MVETAQVVDRCLGGLEEWRTETERNASSNDGKFEIEQVAHRRDTTTNEPARALDGLVGWLGRWSTRDCLDRRTRCLGLETSTCTTRTAPPTGFDDDMADVTRIATLAVEQLSVQHDATAHARGNNHRKEVVMPACGTLPALAECKRLGITVTEHGQPREVAQALGQREVSPAGDVQGRDQLCIRRTWPRCSDSNRKWHRAVLSTSPNQHLRDQPAEVAEQRLVGLGGVHPTAGSVDHRAVDGDETCGDLRSTYVDCDNDVHAELFSTTVTTDWNPILRGEFEKKYWKDLQAFVESERRKTVVYPPHEQVFRALHETSHFNTRVVILGQDPYHGAGQAHGLCFSVNRDVPMPPSLLNIFKELRSDLGLTPPSHGCLEAWAQQGVLLLNTTLTVRANQAASHQGKGWETFTDCVIGAVAAKSEHVVFILWGAAARKKKTLIIEAAGEPRHTIIESAHPSPLSAHNGFFASRPFSRTNAALTAHGQVPIDWEIH